MASGRFSDKCIAKRLYSAATPYVQIAGWLAIFLGVVFGAGGKWQDVQAYGTRIAVIEEKVDKLTRAINRIEDIAEFIGVPPRREK